MKKNIIIAIVVFISAVMAHVSMATPNYYVDGSGNVHANSISLSSLIFSSSYPSLLSAISDSSGKTLVIDKLWNISDDITIPSTVSILMIQGGIISHGSNTVTINGPFSAGLYSTFTGTGPVVFGSGAVKEVYPQWWGGGPGIADSSTAIAAALAASEDVLLSSGTWTANIIISGNKKIYGQTGTVVSASTSSFPIITIDGTASYITGARVSNLRLLGDNQGEGIKIVGTAPNAVRGGTFEQLVIYNTTKAVYVTGTAANEVYNNSFRDIFIDGVYDTGIYSDSGGYNTFERLNITSVQAGKKAIYETSIANNYKDIATDGVIVSSGSHGHFDNITIETLFSAPATSTVFTLNGYYNSIRNLTFTNIDNTKCNVGIDISNTNHYIEHVKWWGANKPDYILKIENGSSGTAIDIATSTYGFNEYMTIAQLASWKISNNLVGDALNTYDTVSRVTSTTSQELDSSILNGKPGEVFDVDIYIVNHAGTARTYWLYFVDSGAAQDTTLTNYQNSGIVAGSTTAASYDTNSSALLASVANNAWFHFTGQLFFNYDGYITINYIQESSTNSIKMGTFRNLASKTILYALFVSSDAAGAIGANSSMYVARKNKRQS